ncbi:MAG: NADH-quinone oxidoreductase subunit NuoH [Armatimonadota bacterium]
MNEILKYLLIVPGVLFFVMVFAPALTWVERRFLALFQDRYGPNRVGPSGMLQVVADMIKLLFKEDWTPPFADRALFVAAPALIIIFTLMSFAVVSFGPGLAVADLNIGLLFFLGMSSLTVYSIVLGGWSSSSKFSLQGALRGVAQMISYEVFMGLSLMGVVVMAQSFNLTDIIQAQRRLWFIVPQFVGFVIFLIAGFAETRRLPFDLPEADNELVAGYHTEYSGIKFALFFLGEYIGIILISAMIVVLFLGGWQALLIPHLPPVLWFLGKMTIFVALFMFARAAFPRPRFDQLMAFGWKVLLPLSLLNLLATGLAVLLWDGYHV